MHPRIDYRFAQPNNYNPHPWRPYGPRFGPVRPMQQHNNYASGYSSSNNNENHWCETCDRGFRTLEILINHKQQHQKCNIDGCQFVAHPKVITKHIQMQHSTGLFKKIAKLNNPEEIQKWREERKKRYPTKENIEKKNAQNKEKFDRGEKMNMRNHRENKFNARDQGIKRKYSHDNNRKNFKRRFPENKLTIEVNDKPLINDIKKTIIPPKKENKLISQVDNSKDLKPFGGILNLFDDISNDNDDVKRDIEINDSIEEDQYIVMDEFEDKSNSKITEPVVCGALSLLIGNYESSDDDDSTDRSPQLPQNQNLKGEHAIEKNVNLKPALQPHMSINIKNNSEKSDDDSGPEEVEIVKDINNKGNTDRPVSSNAELSNLKSSKKEAREREERNRTNNTKNGRKFFKPKLPSTLLEKLLRNEIRQERNIVLQCIRYIIKNKYFEKELSTSN